MMRLFLSLFLLLGTAANFRADAFVTYTKTVLPGSLHDIAVTLKTPLGIIFEEVEPGQPEGVVVADLVPGGNAELDGRVLVGDKLISASAVVLDDSQKPLIGLGGSANTNWKREMIPCGKMTFTSIMNAIKSNTGRWGYTDCRIIVRRTDKSVPRASGTLQRKKADDEEEDKELPIKNVKDGWRD